MSYQGTPQDDVIDQQQQGLLDGPIYGLEGHDRITFHSGIAIGGAGNDILIATSRWATVAYWDSPTGVVVDLAAGTAQDGFGSVDQLINVYTVQGSGHDDVLIGSSADENFYGGGGNNRIIGGGGYDTVDYYFEKSTSADISYDALTDTFTVIKRFANGDRGSDILQGIERIQFSGDGSDNAAFLRTSYVGDFRTGASVPVQFSSGVGLTQLRAGDFNGDGHTDFLLVGQAGTGTALAPSYVMLGDGKGGMREATNAVFGTIPMKVVGGGRTLVADFNQDGISDIFQLDFGDDTPPFPGGINSLYLSSTATGRLVDVSASLPQRPDQNHGGSVGDVNGDGYLDILVNSLDKGNLLLINDGSGRFTESRALIYPSGALESSTFSGMVDVNGDGALDLILGSWDGNQRKTPTKVVLNDGRGNFLVDAPIALPTSGVDQQIVLDVDAIDLNGDGLPDLMLSITNGGEQDVFYQTHYIQLLVNQGNGQFRDETVLRLPQTQQASGLGWYMSLSSVDLNNDGLADILAESAGHLMSSKAYLNRGDGTFALLWESAPGERVQAADMDEDGMLDLVAANDHQLTVWFNKLDNGHVYQANFGGSSLRGSSRADQFVARAGSNEFDGGDGVDLAFVPGLKAAFALVREGSTLQLDNSVLEARLSNVERVHFDDQVVALDTIGVAGQAYRLYQAAFDRAPDAAGLGYWIETMDAGLSLTSVAREFVASTEFVDTYGMLDDGGYVRTIYQNVLHRQPDAAGLAYWEQFMLAGGTRAELLFSFSESAENQDQVASLIADGIAYLPFY